MNRTDAIAAFIATHGTNAPGIFINMVDGTAAGDSAFAGLFASVHTDSDIDDIVDEMDDMLNNDDEGMI